MAARTRRTAEADLPPDGATVRARPLGWNEQLTPEQELDLEPLAEGDRAGWIEGTLTVLRTNQAETGPLIGALVNGWEVDPSTVEEVE